MIDSLRFVNLNGQTWEFNTDTCPLKEFIVEVDGRSVEIPKMQQHGVWPSYTYWGKMLIHTTGDILEDTPENYILSRLTMLNILIPAGVVQTQRRLGRLFLTYSGIEEMYADVTLDGYPSLPMQALYPSVTEFQITWKSFTPYMTGVSTGAFYSI